MMKIIAYEVMQDEMEVFPKMAKQYGVDIALTDKPLNRETIALCDGAQGVAILGASNMDRTMLGALKEKNIHYLATRTIGYNHIDVAYANRIGIKVSNAQYAPDCVADFVIMLILVTLRKYKQAVYRQNVNDYSLRGLIGKNLSAMTVGVIGTGSIGCQVIKELSGFGCRVLAWNRTEKEEVKQYATYVPLETLYRQSDTITIHLPLTKQTYHVIDRATIAQMKDGVVLINTSRGELMDVAALIEGIETEKIGAIGTDVFEGEGEIYHENRMYDIISNRDMAYLRQFPNVVMTQHIAFYTETSVRQMVESAVDSLVEFNRTGTARKEIVIG